MKIFLTILLIVLGGLIILTLFIVGLILIWALASWLVDKLDEILYER